MSSSRRSFVASLAASIGGASLSPLAAHATSSPLLPQGRRWDLTWLDSLRGKHRQVFDLRDVASYPLRVVGNYLRGHKELYGLAPKDLTTVVGIAFGAFPINASDALWQKYPIGRLWDVKDPRTNEWSVRNIYADVVASDSSASPLLQPADAVPMLVAGGTIFWQCYNGLQSVAARIAADIKADRVALLAELERGLLPHVRLIVAHTVLIGLVQERGCAYEAL